MDEIQFIVAKLNEPPFKKKLSLVDFDDKSPSELVQLLMDVFTSMDESMGCDVRQVDPEELSAKVFTFLSVLKYPGLPTEEELREPMKRALVDGEKHVIYPVLHWSLQRLPALQKRAYLAKYLVPEPIPQEFMQDEALVQLSQDYRALQGQFKEVHKQIDKLRAEPTRPAEVKNEIATLEDERKQLATKIDRLKRQTESEDGFGALLEATSQLRQHQDEEAQMGEKRRRQLMILQHAKARSDEAQKRLQSLKQSQSGSMTALEMLGALEAEVTELGQRVTEVMPREIEQETARMTKLQEALFEQPRSREDVEELSSEVDLLDERCAQLRQQIDSELKGRLDNKLAMFRQTAVVAGKKLAQKESELEEAEQALGKAKAEVEAKDLQLSEVGGSASKFMTREELKAYGNQLREKTHVYKKSKLDLAESRAELVRLGRTEQILRGRDRNLGEFLDQLEAKRGVSGYRDVVSKLEHASAEARGVDALKEGTLEEISAIVRNMSNQLKERKAFLAPQIKKLREVRKEFQEVDAEYSRKKQSYDKVAVGLEVERQAAEHEADALQEDCLQHESNYHYYANLTGIAQASVDRVRNEDKWSAGQGHLLPNFRTYADLYKDKEARQKSLKEQLMKQKAAISSNEPEAMEQRKLFASLASLMAAKVNSKAAKIDGEGGADRGGQGFSSEQFDMGSAKVMRLG